MIEGLILSSVLAAIVIGVSHLGLLQSKSAQLYAESSYRVFKWAKGDSSLDTYDSGSLHGGVVKVKMEVNKNFATEVPGLLMPLVQAHAYAYGSESEGSRVFPFKFSNRFHRITTLFGRDGYAATNAVAHRRIESNAALWSRTAFVSKAVAQKLIPISIQVDRAWAREAPSVDWLSRWEDIVPVENKTINSAYE